MYLNILPTTGTSPKHRSDPTHSSNGPLHQKHKGEMLKCSPLAPHSATHRHSDDGVFFAASRAVGGEADPKSSTPALTLSPRFRLDLSRLVGCSSWGDNSAVCARGLETGRERRGFHASTPSVLESLQWAGPRLGGAGCSWRAFS